jgi:hypothetical protein
MQVKDMQVKVTDTGDRGPIPSTGTAHRRKSEGSPKGCVRAGSKGALAHTEHHDRAARDRRDDRRAPARAVRCATCGDEHLVVELPRTGWQILHVSEQLHVFRHRCVSCGQELFEDVRDDAPVQLVELFNRYGVPPLCDWCQVDLASCGE